MAVVVQQANDPLDGPWRVLDRLESALSSVLTDRVEIVRLALSAFAARGHLLIEDVPGVGKTTLARALARAIGGEFRRIQFTSDLLPSDVLGVNVYNPKEALFSFHRGPIFANVVLADEINRTGPRTQSSLLEAMSEGRVSIDNTTYELPRPFIVIATQNPVGYFGTYSLPESQLDRFLLRLQLGYPSPSDERRIVTADSFTDPIDALEEAAAPLELIALQRVVDHIQVDQALYAYAERVVHETRRSSLLSLGISPRGFQSWYRVSRAYALISRRNYCVPDDFKSTAIPALAHRVVLAGDISGEIRRRPHGEAEHVLSDLLERVPVPI
jgi:MoxR-like ATPase